jgi:hypothetical protein
MANGECGELVGVGQRRRATIAPCGADGLWVATTPTRPGIAVTTIGRGVLGHGVLGCRLWPSSSPGSSEVPLLVIDPRLTQARIGEARA